jgi:dTDP-4-dehydrorhamnose reductase
MTRILITGASGLLGINLAMEAMVEHEVVGVDRGKLKSPPFRVFSMEHLNRGAIDPILDTVQPDWLVNCTAMTNLEVCEKYPEQARRLNTDLPAQLASACAERAIRFVHISTDAVFDGEKMDYYTEEDVPNPLGLYSKTKLDGEHAVFAENPDALVARVNFFGWSLSGTHSLGEFFVNNLSEGKNVNGFIDIIFCPILVNVTARLLLEMLQKNLSGLYNVVGGQSMSKYQFGVEIARTFGLREDLILPRSVLTSELTAKRSPNLRLSTHKLSTDLGHDIPPFSTSLGEFYTQFQQGYPQKIRSYQQF